MSASWSALPGEFLAGVDPAYPDETEMCSIMDGLAAISHGQSYLAWAQYRSIAVMYDRLVGARLTQNTTVAGGFLADGVADCAARIARQAAIPRHRAETLIDEAIALRDRLPDVGKCLRDGVIAQWQAQLVVSRTDLIGVDDRVATAIDAAIATTLRSHRGSWSRPRLRDMIDRIVFRHDPDGVRERRRDALDKRGVWTASHPDGTGEITAVMAAENIRSAAAAVRALADAACDRDPRTRRQRSSDAMFALLTGTRFDCQCAQPDCTATIPEPGTVPPMTSRAIIHVICEEATLTETAGAAAGFMDGHGLIDDVHVRDIAARPDTTIKPLTPTGGPVVTVAADSTPGDSKAGGTAAEDTVTYPGAQPGDPYGRPPRATRSCAYGTAIVPNPAVRNRLSTAIWTTSKSSTTIGPTRAGRRRARTSTPSAVPGIYSRRSGTGSTCSTAIPTAGWSPSSSPRRATSSPVKPKPSKTSSPVWRVSATSKELPHHGSDGHGHHPIKHHRGGTGWRPSMLAVEPNADEITGATTPVHRHRSDGRADFDTRTRTLHTLHRRDTVSISDRSGATAQQFIVSGLR